MKTKNFSKYLGCLIGGAAGDTLGYAVEFMSEQQIFSKYGDGGIRFFDYGSPFSDDTQMTLFTAAGILFGQTRMLARGIGADMSCYIAASCKDWIHTQNGGYEDKYDGVSWLINEKRLYKRRAPGNTCLSALSGKETGTVSIPINDSKGCGGVMRVAPVGLFFGNSDIRKTDMIAAEAAAITHGHELGYIPAAALAHITALAAHTEMELEEIVSDAIETTCDIFKDAKHIGVFRDIMNRVVVLSKTSVNDLDAIHSLGEGWVAEEALAIAVYCALKYKDDFKKAITTAVNHGGDSDSTGAVCGNILGAYLGANKIPHEYIVNLEMLDVICETAVDLYNGCQVDYYESKNEQLLDKIWNDKYIFHTFRLPECGHGYYWDTLERIGNKTFGELEKDPIYRDCVHIYCDTLDERIKESFLCGTLRGIDEAMTMNMGGGAPKNTYDVMMNRIAWVENMSS